MKQLRYTFRILKRNPLLVFVTLPGLAFGLAAFLLLSVYVRHELSYDQQFPTKERVVRLVNRVVDKQSIENYPISLRDAYTEIPAKVPGIEAATQIYRGWNVNVDTKTQRFEKKDLLYADPGFFKVFGLSLIAGNRETALRDLNTVVLTDQTANQIFGTTDCIGKVITISDQPFTVTGIIKKLPSTTHFQFDLLASMASAHPERIDGLDFYTYFLLNPHANRTQTLAQINQVNSELMKPWATPFDLKVTSNTESLPRIHLHTKADYDLSEKGSLGSIYLIAGLAFFILLIAMINYINLYVLHGEKKNQRNCVAKGIGSRQTDAGQTVLRRNRNHQFLCLVPGSLDNRNSPPVVCPPDATFLAGIRIVLSYRDFNRAGFSRIISINQRCIPFIPLVRHQFGNRTERPA